MSPREALPRAGSAHPPNGAAPTARHLVSIADLTDGELDGLVWRSHEFSACRTTAAPLRGRVVGIHFRRTSTRTRAAFSTAALRLGGSVLSFAPADLQDQTGETPGDTGRVLSSMLDALVTRTTGDPAELRSMAAQDRMAVINAMTEDEHPTQAITDLSTMLTVLGGLEGRRVLYVGEGNNTTAALALALSRYRGTELLLRTPPGYGLAPAKLAAAVAAAEAHGAVVEQQHHLDDLPASVDIVYTTRWQTTGTVKQDPQWRSVFRPFRVDIALMARFPTALFMHDLPAHRGEEVDAEVLDGDRSIAFQQAEHKLHSAMAVLEWCLGGRC